MNLSSIFTVLRTLYEKHPALARALGDMALAAVRSPKPWESAFRKFLRHAFPHIGKAVADKLNRETLRYWE